MSDTQKRTLRQVETRNASAGRKQTAMVNSAPCRFHSVQLRRSQYAGSYWDYVQRLARERSDGAALRHFDRKRAGKKLSNEQWQNFHDPEAKIGRTKDGATDMIYLPEHTVDLESGAIVQAQVLPGDHRDSEELSERVSAALIKVQEAKADPEARPETITGDKGYFSLLEIGRLQELNLKTVISDPHRAASMAKGYCASAASTSSAALPTCSTPAGCAGRRCAGWKT